MFEKFIKDCKPILRFFEPKPVPVLDDAGNVVDYTLPKLCCMPFKQAEQFRQKIWPNELGMSADPNNVEGFRVLVDLINQNRNLRGNGIVELNSDDASAVLQNQELNNLSKELES